MLFKPELIELIKSGRKTQTRRIVQKGDTYDNNYAGHAIRVRRKGRLKWETGRHYVYQPGRGKPGVGCFQLRSIRLERVNFISEIDARAEGFNSAREFKERFRQINPKAEHDAWVWVLDWGGNGIS